MNGRLAGIVIMLAGLLPGAGFAEFMDEWRFRVLLDGREIGHHRFTLREHGEFRKLQSEADFEVQLLFVTLYRYRHVAEEIWKGDCLKSVSAATDANGKPTRVRGQHTENAFRVTTPDGVDVLPACVMSFAYWNPDFLEQQRLLNPQDGAYLDVSVNGPFDDSLVVSGRPLAAQRYQLSAEEMDITLWYSAQGDWLALESDAPGDRVLRYERDWSGESAL